jgi:uncharacterized surface protein with fasciclin (FAS1) repeats/plastocyanin
MKKLLVVLAILFIGILLAGCTTQPPAVTPTPTPTPVPTPTAPPLKSIVDTAVADGRFTTLVAALQAAKLDGTLSGAGPFTVFAPTDDAFNKLPEGTVATLLQEPEGQLKQILLYHVVSGKVMAADVVKLTKATTLEGSDLTITVTDGKVKVNDANVIITDIEASNGVIHVIDAVLIPPVPPTPTPTATPTATPTPQPSVTITFNRDLTVTPGTTVVVPVGGKVIWKNDDPFKPHGVVAVNLQTGKYFGGMSTVVIPYGKTLEVTFDTVGAYDYKTTFQPSVLGKVIVTR